MNRKEYMKEYHKKHYQDHKEEYKSRNANYKKEHPEIYKYNSEVAAAYRNNNRETLNERNRRLNAESNLKASNSRKIWTLEELDTLEKMYNKGIKYKEIGEILGRSIRSVQKAVARYITQTEDMR